MLEVLKEEGRRHRFQLCVALLATAALIAGVAWYGRSYYLEPAAARARDPLHRALRPSGSIGLKLGILGFVYFCLIYLYPIRKRWAWLRQFGKTRHWLDFHVLMGLTAPLLISLHSGFRFHGIAGMAFWIMWAVVASGIVGRYLYSQIPRHLNTAEMTLKEIEASREELRRQLEAQTVLTAAEVEEALHVPDPEAVSRMSAPRALFVMLATDVARPFSISRLRRRSLGPVRRWLSLQGLLPAGSPEFEQVIRLVRRQAWLSTKIVFLGKVQRLFHLWHVVHRPFSYSFAVLAFLHVGVVILMGYF